MYRFCSLKKKKSINEQFQKKKFTENLLPKYNFDLTYETFFDFWDLLFRLGNSKII